MYGSTQWFRLGEKITILIETAGNNKHPLIIFSSSGGAITFEERIRDTSAENFTVNAGTVSTSARFFSRIFKKDIWKTYSKYYWKIL